VIVNEYPLARRTLRARQARHLLRPRHGRWPRLGASAAALGIKAADSSKLVVATLGDGSYMVCQPCRLPLDVGCPHAADPDDHLQQQPLRRGGNSTLSMYANGRAGRDNGRFLADLNSNAPLGTSWWRRMAGMASA